MDNIMPEMPEKVSQELLLEDYHPPLKTTVMLLGDEGVLHITQNGTLTPEAPVALNHSEVLKEVKARVLGIVVDQTLALSGEGSFTGLRINAVLNSEVQKITFNPRLEVVGEKQVWKNISVATSDLLLLGGEITIGGSIGQLNGKVINLGIDDASFSGSVLPKPDPHFPRHPYKGKGRKQ